MEPSQCSSFNSDVTFCSQFNNGAHLRPENGAHQSESPLQDVESILNNIEKHVQLQIKGEKLLERSEVSSYLNEIKTLNLSAPKHIALAEYLRNHLMKLQRNVEEFEGYLSPNMTMYSDIIDSCQLSQDFKLMGRNRKASPAVPQAALLRSESDKSFDIPLHLLSNDNFVTLSSNHSDSKVLSLQSDNASEDLFLNNSNDDAPSKISRSKRGSSFNFKKPRNISYRPYLPRAAKKYSWSQTYVDEINFSVDFNDLNASTSEKSNDEQVIQTNLNCSDDSNVRQSACNDMKSDFEQSNPFEDWNEYQENEKRKLADNDRSACSKKLKVFPAVCNGCEKDYFTELNSSTETLNKHLKEINTHSCDIIDSLAASVFDQPNLPILATGNVQLPCEKKNDNRNSVDGDTELLDTNFDKTLEELNEDISRQVKKVLEWEKHLLTNFEKLLIQNRDDVKEETAVVEYNESRNIFTNKTYKTKTVTVPRENISLSLDDLTKEIHEELLQRNTELREKHDLETFSSMDWTKLLDP